MIHNDVRKKINELIIRCAKSGELARSLLEKFLRDNNFGSSLRREITDYFYCGIRFYGLLKKDTENFSCEKAYNVLESKNINSPSILSEISGFSLNFAETVLKNVDDIRPFFYRAPMSIRVNTLKTTKDLMLDKFSGKYNASPTKVSPFGITFNQHINVRQLNEFKKGYFEIQDEASQLIPLLLDIKPGEKILDFCAGTGGKALGISSLTFNTADIYIHDINENRIQKAINRSKKTGAKFKKLKKGQSRFFDKVLVDAPCSGVGSMRRDADLPMRLDNNKLEKYTDLQKNIFNKALSYVKTGGLIAYVTCSFLEQENEKQVNNFLDNNHQLELVKAVNILDKDISDKLSIQDFFRTSPAFYGMDALFGSVFRVS